MLDILNEYAKIARTVPGAQESWGKPQGSFVAGIYEAGMVSSKSKSGLIKFWDSLKAFQRQVAIALTKVLLFIVYFTVFAVSAIVARLLNKDLLHPGKPEPGSHWLPRAAVEHSLESFARQF